MSIRQDEHTGTGLLWKIFLSNGDRYSFSALYKIYSGELFSYGIHLGFGEEQCKDAIQDVFFTLFTSRKKLADIRNPAAYLFRSFKHRLIDILRRDSRSGELDPHSEAFAIDVTVIDQIIDREEAAQIRARVEELLSRLTEREREILYLRYKFTLSYDEVGDICGITAESARKSVYRIMEKLRSGPGHGN